MRNENFFFLYNINRHKCLPAFFFKYQRLNLLLNYSYYRKEIHTFSPNNSTFMK